MKTQPHRDQRPVPQFSNLDSRFSIPQPEPQRAIQSKLKNSKSKIWLWCVAACVFQLVVWTAWIVLAAKNPVKEVPLTTAAH